MAHNRLLARDRISSQPLRQGRVYRPLLCPDPDRAATHRKGFGAGAELLFGLPLQRWVPLIYPSGS